MRKYFAVICMVLLLAGCGKFSEGDDRVNQAMRVEGETKSYVVETWDTGITPEFQPLSYSFVLTEDMLYYAGRSVDNRWGVGGVSLAEESRPAALLWLEDEFIDALAAVRGAEGQRIMVLAGRNGAGESFLAEYDMEGTLLWRQPYEESGQIILRLAQDGDGHFYAMSQEQVLLFNGEGIYQGSIPCPGERYMDLCAAADGSVYVTYRDGSIDRSVLARLQYQGQKLEGDTGVWGEGQLNAGRDGCLLLREGNTVYAYDPGRQESTKLLELMDYDLMGKQLQGMWENSAGELLLVNWEIARYDRPVQLTRLSESKGQQAGDGRQTVTWLVIGPILPGVDDTLVASFNRQSKEYRVVMESVSLEGVTVSETSSNYDLNREIFMCVNTRLLASESADLISFTNYPDMERYLTKGYLEDLTPYIAQSEHIDRENYRSEPLECYARGDALYSLPASFCIDVLMGKESELGAEPGWTVGEFLDWLQEHPDAVTREGMTKENVLDFCLMGTLEEYVQADLGLCDFEGEVFRELLLRVQGLTTDSAAHWDDWQKMLEEKRPVLEQGWASTFSHCHSWEMMYGEPLVYKGYPSSDGSPCYFYNGGGLAILGRSACKEGAYAFWEYYLLNGVSDFPSYYTDKTAFTESMTRLADEQYAYTADGKMVYRLLSETQSDWAKDGEELEWISNLSEKQREKQLAMMEHVRIDTLENQTVRNIIREEVSAYFSGDKSLGDTCQVIQSRVGLYLAEMR